MKKFFTTMMACLAAIIISSMAFFFFGMFVISLFFAANTTTTTYTPKLGSVLEITLAGELLEREKEDPLSVLFSDYKESNMGLKEILSAIKKAETTSQVSGIHLNCKGLSAGYASLGMIREALQQFKANSGKFVTAYADNYTQNEYYLSSMADKVILNPMGMLDFRGIVSSHIFYAKALEKLGVEVQVFKVGTFKSAVEPYIATQMSPANRLQTGVYINSIWNTLLGEIAASRHQSIDKLNEYANASLAFTPTEQYKKTGMIDELLYATQVDSLLAMMAKVSTDKLHKITIAQLNSISAPMSKSSNTIAVLYAEGEIDGAAKDEGINTANLVKEILKLKADSTVKAVVMRINSPGGSAFGSEQVWQAVELLKKDKPMVVSMGDYAASGGYYIACNANRIFAAPTTLTGSIGVFGLVPNAGNLLTQKMGVTYDEVTTNKYGEFPTITKAMTLAEKNLMQASVERTYQLFLTRCSNGRSIPMADVAKIAEGRVWTGENALSIKLVDELGSLQNAIDWTAKSLALTDYRIESYPHQQSYYERLLEEFAGYASVRIAKKMAGDQYETLQLFQKIANRDHIQALMEESIVL